MLRKLALLLLPLALLAAACSSGGSPDEQGTTEADAPGSEVPAGDDLINADDGSGETGDPSAAGDTGDAGSLLTSLNPFAFLQGAGQPSFGEVDPTLKAALLDENDLPSGFQPLGEFSFDAPGELGGAQMAMNMFTDGDPTSNDLADMGAMVMSGVVLLPPEAIEQFRQAEELSDADLEELDAVSQELAGFAELELLDASGLGESGFGMHMALDFGEFLGAFGAPASETENTAVIMDMYAFLRGEQAFMVMVMSPETGSSDVDARDLAERLDEKAEDA